MLKDLKEYLCTARIFVLLIAVFLCTCGFVFSQETTGSLSGEVKEENGSPLPGVTISLIGERGTKTSYTGADGKYTFSDLQPALYDVSAELSGFVTLTKTDVEVKA